MANRHDGAPTAPTNGRTTELVGLRLKPDVALRLRVSADAAGRTMSDYVAALVDGRAGDTSAAWSNEDRWTAFDHASRTANAIFNLNRLLEGVRGELGRTHGGVKHLFETSRTAAEAHKYELAAAARALRDAIAKADKTVDEVGAAMVPIQAELAVFVKRIAATK